MLETGWRNTAIGYDSGTQTLGSIGPEVTEATTAPAGNKIKNISIREVSRGYIVDVGCQTFVIETSVSLIQKLTQYISEPEKTEHKWFKGELF